jgi:hypothetical protein
VRLVLCTEVFGHYWRNFSRSGAFALPDNKRCCGAARHERGQQPSDRGEVAVYPRRLLSGPEASYAPVMA